MKERLVDLSGFVLCLQFGRKCTHLIDLIAHLELNEFIHIIWYRSGMVRRMLREKENPFCVIVHWIPSQSSCRKVETVSSSLCAVFGSRFSSVDKLLRLSNVFIARLILWSFSLSLWHSYGDILTHNFLRFLVDARLSDVYDLKEKKTTCTHNCQPATMSPNVSNFKTTARRRAC